VIDPLAAVTPPAVRAAAQVARRAQVLEGPALAAILACWDRPGAGREPPGAAAVGTMAMDRRGGGGGGDGRTASGRARGAPQEQPRELAPELIFVHATRCLCFPK
jgi:hypothetical protein